MYSLWNSCPVLFAHLGKKASRRQPVRSRGGKQRRRDTANTSSPPEKRSKPEDAPAAEGEASLVRTLPPEASEEDSIPQCIVLVTLPTKSRPMISLYHEKGTSSASLRCADAFSTVHVVADLRVLWSTGANTDVTLRVSQGFHSGVSVH